MRNRAERLNRVEGACKSISMQTRQILDRVRRNKHIDPSDIEHLRGFVDALRHHCEMHNEERLQAT